MFNTKMISFPSSAFSSFPGTILIRTNRVSRIFNEKLLRTGKISCLGNHWQMFILGCLLITEIVLTVAWVFGSSSQVFPQVIYSKASKDASLICSLSGSHIGFSLWLIYNAGLVVVCTYQAFLVRKVPHNYNESRLIAFNMTTLCITVLVYIPSYMGTSGWYRTIISCFMLMFLGTLTWASIFAPKIYIILFRPHKNIPMRPSVSSITLGVISPSPTGVSSISEQNMCSRKNSLNPNEDGTWGGSWAKTDSARELNENVAITEEDDSPCEQFDDFSEKELKENQETDTSIADKSQPQQENCKMTPQKNTSMVHFEDEMLNECDEGRDTQVFPEKKTSGSQGGILRRTYNSEIHENSINGIVPRKKKTSLVRFQDEVLSCDINNLTDYHRIALPAKGEEPIQIPKGNLDAETNNKGEVYCSCASTSAEKTETNRVTEKERKRKISVFSFQ